MKLKLAAFATLITLAPAQAFAYLDPGTGSIIIQALVAAIAGVAIYFGQLKLKILSFFSRKPNHQESEVSETNASEDPKGK